MSKLNQVLNQGLNQSKNLIKPVFKLDLDAGDLLPFAASHALVTISVGQEVHEGEKLKATLGLINSSFKRCTICVDDTLQRHTLAMKEAGDASTMVEVLSEQWMIYSKKLGDEWLIRNFSAYSKLTIPFEIIRWDRWLKHENYLNIYRQIKNLYEQNSDVYKVFESTSQEFLNRYLPRITGLTGLKDITEISEIFQENAKKLSLMYLFEECSALCLWALEGYDYEIYPGRRNQAMSVIHERLVQPIYGTKASSVWIKFKNRKQLKPQVLEIIEG